MSETGLETPCLEWSGAKTRGYGSRRYKGRTVYAHRLAYCEAHGLGLEDIAGQVVRHKCDNPPCCNPDHLELGTQAENVQDSLDRGRHANPRALTQEDAEEIRRRYEPWRGTRWHPNPNGQSALAREYGVSQSVIQKIVNNVTYK